MRYLALEEDANTAILIKDTHFKSKELKEEYTDLLDAKCCAFSLEYDGKKPSAKFRKEYVAKLVPVLHKKAIDYILVMDGEYFKTLTGAKKLTGYIGELLPIKGSEHIQCMYMPSYATFYFNPEAPKLRDRIVDLFNDVINGVYQRTEVVFGTELYPKTISEIRNAVASLHQYDAVTLDIEAYSLNHYDAFIGTVGISWSQTEGMAFCVDTQECEPEEIQVWCQKDKKFKTKIGHHRPVINKEVRAILFEFLSTYKGKIIYHNVSYDAYVLVYQLWMTHLLDVKGMYEGLEVMMRNWHCTQLITYLATNSATGNHLGLKYQSQEFTGNYAEDVTDIRLLEVEPLLKYNLIDSCATWFVMDKHYDTVVLDDQLELYNGLFRDSIYDIIQMQLTGLCLDMEAVLAAEEEISTLANKELKVILNHPSTILAQEQIALAKQKANYDKRKRDNKNPDAVQMFPIERFRKPLNPNSGNQIAVLLYEVLGLPVIDLTDSKAPATGNKTIKKLLVYSKTDDQKELLNSLIEYMLADKILSSFIPAFKRAPKAKDGYHYLYGKYKLGGCVSGRLSSSDPNMQNIPSGGRFSKVIKKCFIAPKGQLFAGIDAASLEDRIDSLLTKDTNKIKVYTQRYDGHSLRAFSYFGEHMPDIEDTVESVNSIKHKYPQYRQDSKAPTFALTYAGMWLTLVKNCGFTEEVAKKIEFNYHELYKESDQWKEAKLAQTAIDGYTTVAFGLRVRAPIMASTVMGTSKTPFQAEAEARTIGNAFGQSYCLINGRNGAEITKKIRASKWKYSILLVAQIHDACYFRLPDSLEAVKFLNDIACEAYEWQDLPEIQHPEVGLSGELDIFYPTWKDAITLPMYGEVPELVNELTKEANKRKEK